MRIIAIINMMTMGTTMRRAMQHLRARLFLLRATACREREREMEGRREGGEKGGRERWRGGGGREGGGIMCNNNTRYSNALTSSSLFFPFPTLTAARDTLDSVVRERVWEGEGEGGRVRKRGKEVGNWFLSMHSRGEGGGGGGGGGGGRTAGTLDKDT